MNIKLRELRSQPIVERGQEGILLSDSLGISQKMLFIPGSLVLLLTLMDGTRDEGTLRTGFELRTGTPISNSTIEQILSQLDEALFLENERFSHVFETALTEYRAATSRPPALAGKSYPADAGELKLFIQRYFDESGVRESECHKDVKGLICPHIDFQRGGHIYAEVWSRAKAAVREAELAVILGTDHNEGEGSITLTRQDYETPWGIIPTAQDVVEELVSEIGEDAFRHELNHLGEHSVESAIIWLHYLVGDKPLYLLPVLCGSFQPFVQHNKSPLTETHIASTIEILKSVCNRQRTIIIAAADLAHMGPVFGDPSPLDHIGQARMANQDEKLMDIMSYGSAEDFFAEISSEKDRRHICGMPPIYIALSILAGTDGMPSGYAQCPASEDGTSLVSICGMLYLSLKPEDLKKR